MAGNKSYSAKAKELGSREEAAGLRKN